MYPFTETAYSTDPSCNFTNYLDMNKTITTSWEIYSDDDLNFIGGYIYQMPVCVQNISDAVCWLPNVEIQAISGALNTWSPFFPKGQPLGAGLIGINSFQSLFSSPYTTRVQFSNLTDWTFAENRYTSSSDSVIVLSQSAVSADLVGDGYLTIDMTKPTELSSIGFGRMYSDTSASYTEILATGNILEFSTV